MKILAVGDMHLGRTPGRLPPHLSGDELGPAEAWRRTVGAALREGVRAVALAGDVVDRDDDFFEAYRQLEDGVRKLADAGIEVVGVAGNHDVKVLPRLAEHIPEFKLLGTGDKWEAYRIANDVTLWGWSFPQTRVTRSPLPDRPFDIERGVNLGLLHCDRDGGAGSPYAPVVGSALDRAGLDGWLLGHIHKPDALTAAAPSGYLGSLTGLGRGEPGVRGPWLLTFAGGRLTAVAQLPLAPLRWEPLNVDLGGIAEADDAKGRLLGAVRELDARLAADGAPPSAVGLSVIFRGRSGLGGAAAGALSEDDREHTFTGTQGTQYFVVHTHLATQPEIDLQELAKHPDPAGLLAARLLWLDRPAGDAQRDALVDSARRRLRSQAAKTAWSGLPDADQDIAAVDWLRQAGIRALDKLLAQHAAEHAKAP